MKRTSSAIFIAALSGAIAGPPAFLSSQAFADDDVFGAPEVRLSFDAGAVLSAGDRDTELLFDLEGDLTLETFTQAGRPYGLVVGGRAQRDRGTRPFGGLAGQCPPGLGDCASLEGPVSGLRAHGAPGETGVRAELDAAYVFYDTGWGEIRLGRGDGAARLDDVSGPTAFRLTRADGGRVATSGLAGANTVNHAASQDAKLVFRSIALGQEISVGTLRASVSWTPSVRHCGVDACAREYGPAGLVSPVTDNVLEVGVHYAIRRGDHVVDVSASLSDGEDATGHAGFEGLQTRTVGLRWENGAWSAGGRYLSSNNGVSADAGYTAWSASAGYETGPWLLTLEYAGFNDSALHVSGESWQFGGSRLIGERWIAGLGLQSASRSEPELTVTGRRQVDRDSVNAFAELGWQF
jgi:hypothetical protein